MAKARVEPVSFFADARGLVIEPICDTALANQRNVHIVLTAPGAVRGNHYHQHSTEVSVIIGPALVRLREDGVLRDVIVPPGQALRFTFPPEVSHAFQNTGTEPMLAMAFNTAVFDKQKPDTIRDVLILDCA
jgi:dTDP-4-dehydrorhamnose 3,5-epimerase-like enzyme